MSTLLVTGAQGFLGRYLVSQLLAGNPDTRVIGIGRSPRNDNSFTHPIQLGERSIAALLPRTLRQVADNDRYSYMTLDLHNVAGLTDLLRRARPAVIFHLASALRDDPVDALCRTNIEGSVRLMEALAAAGLPECRLVFSSSGGVYGIPQAGQLPIQENVACLPNDLYSMTKLAAEHVVRTMSRQIGTPLLTARVFNVVGAGQDERHVCGRIMSQLTSVQSAAGRGVHVGSLSPTRDFIDVHDVADGLAWLAEHGERGEVYNLCSGQEISIEKLLELSLDLTQLRGKVLVHHLPGRVADIPRHVGSTERLSAIGFRPAYTLKQSLTDVLEYYRDCWRETPA